MPRVEVNRSGEMEVFVQVVERGGFSAAARMLLMTPSAVSKLVARLEARLGTHLVHRSTRKLQLTAEGQQFYERCVRVLADIDEAERSASAKAMPRGRVTINTSFAFGTEVLIPLVPRLIDQHPQLTVDIELTDGDGCLILTVRDDGVGIGARSGEGFGLHMMESRARMLGAALHVAAGGRGGTTVTCSLAMLE